MRARQERVKARNSGVGEQAYTVAVAVAMKANSMLCAGNGRWRRKTQKKKKISSRSGGRRLRLRRCVKKGRKRSRSEQRRKRPDCTCVRNK